MKKYLTSILFFFTIPVYANISTKEADYGLLTVPPAQYVQPHVVAYNLVENYTKPMFSKSEKLRLGLGYQNYKVVKNLADTGNPYAQYNAALYRILNEDYFEFDLPESLLMMKKAADSGVLDAKYSLAMIYQRRSLEISKLLNVAKNQKNNEAEINNNANRLVDIGTQYVIEGAQKGHEKSFMMACNFYVRGHYLEKNSIKAAMCYENAVKVFKAPAAYGILAKIYFDDPHFDSLEYEKQGITLAKTGALLGDTFAMSILGLRLIYPKFIDYSDAETGTELIKAAFQHEDPTAKTYAQKYFDGSWRLLMPPIKPMRRLVKGEN